MTKLLHNACQQIPTTQQHTMSTTTPRRHCHITLPTPMSPPFHHHHHHREHKKIQHPGTYHTEPNRTKKKPRKQAKYSCTTDVGCNHLCWLLCPSFSVTASVLAPPSKTNKAVGVTNFIFNIARKFNITRN